MYYKKFIKREKTILQKTMMVNDIYINLNTLTLVPQLLMP